MNRKDIQQLQQIEGYPCVTITLPTNRASPENRQDPIRVKNLAAQATNRLLKEFSKREIEPIMLRLDKMIAEIDFHHTLDGMTLFANRDFARAAYLPFTLEERVVVDKNFYTRDLVFALNRTPRYWTLVLSEKPTRLYEGTRDDLVEIQEGGFPLNHEGPGGEQSLPGGFGIKVSAYRDEYHRKFFREIDALLTPFLANDPLPLAVIGVDRYLAFFDEVTAHKAAVLATLAGSHDQTSPHELGKLIWPLVKAGLAEQRQNVLEQLEAAVGAKKSASGVGDVWRMANEGRGSLLLLEEDFHYPARLDETGTHLVSAEDATEPGVMDDAVDKIIDVVLTKQGRVVFMDKGQLGEHQRIALILRY